LFITKAKKSFTHVQLEQCYAQKNRILGPQDRKPAKLILSRPAHVSTIFFDPSPSSRPQNRGERFQKLSNRDKTTKFIAWNTCLNRKKTKKTPRAGALSSSRFIFSRSVFVGGMLQPNPDTIRTWPVVASSAPNMEVQRHQFWYADSDQSFWLYFLSMLNEKEEKWAGGGRETR
jgi:hypothetical protein